MRIALAQIQPESGAVAANIQKHLQFVEQAVAERADAIFFPELSLSGYEPNLAEALAIAPQDERLDAFQHFSDHNQLTIGIGAPLRSARGVQIGLLIFQPRQARTTYSKQMLHPDEQPFFVPGHQQTILQLKRTPLAPAICYESLQLEHVQQAHQLGAKLYLASVAKSQKGIDKARVHYPQIAQQFDLPVLMVNSIGFCDNFLSAGQTAIWSPTGTLVDQLDPQSERLLLYEGP